MRILFNRHMRDCNKEYKYKDITIPKDSGVVIPLFIIHRDPAYWKNPEKFDPLRYSYN